MKILTSPEIESLLSAICKAWHEQLYPRTLVLRLSGATGPGPSARYGLLRHRKICGGVGLANLIEEHFATVETSARSTAVWVQMDEIVEAVSRVATEAA